MFANNGTTSLSDLQDYISNDVQGHGQRLDVLYHKLQETRKDQLAGMFGVKGIIEEEEIMADRSTGLMYVMEFDVA